MFEEFVLWVDSFFPGAADIPSSVWLLLAFFIYIIVAYGFLLYIKSAKRVFDQHFSLTTGSIIASHIKSISRKPDRDELLNEIDAVEEDLKSNLAQSSDKRREIERLSGEFIVHYGSSEEIGSEFFRKLEIARQYGVREISSHIAVAKSQKISATSLRSLIFDIHYRQAEVLARTKLARAYLTRTGFLAFVFGATFLLYLFIMEPFVAYSDARYVGFGFAMMVGAFGASFFMLVRARGELEDTTIDALVAGLEWMVLIFRILFGAAAAAVLYFAFAGDVLSGTIFPDLNQLSSISIKGITGIAEIPSEALEAGPARTLPNKEVGLLFFWSFLAGYSERLVVSLLEKKESDFMRNQNDIDPIQSQLLAAQLDAKLNSEEAPSKPD